MTDTSTNGAGWTKDELIAEIENATVEKWDDDKHPLLLSELGMALTKKKGDYRPAIAPLKLRQFIATQLSDRVVIVTHPTQFQKIALIPVGQQFSFSGQNNSEDATAEDSDKIKPSIWAAFVKPIAQNTERYLDLDDLRFQDRPFGSAPNSPNSKVIPGNLIVDGRGPDYDAREVAKRIKSWAGENNIPEERLLSRDQKMSPGGNSFFETFRGLSDSDLRRIEIPFDIVMKLANK